MSPHERIGRYEVLRKIATGGMAELFLAKQVGMEGFEKVVAIKRILAHLAFDEEFINMFRDEARIVAKLSHPNIVQIYDLGKSDDTYFIAMEYIPGRNLSSVAKKAKSKSVPLPPEYIARCIAQACEGLYYAHTRQDIDGKPLKIVHRDVSPQNIILAFSGGVKLVDFGIAKAATKIAHTRAGVLKGKYAYMSPEQIRGDEIDARSDLFAVGIVLYELLCGKRPFEKENSIQTLKAIVQEPHVDCRILNAAIPDGLASIIDRALTKTPGERWSSAQELQLALEDFVASTGKRCNNIAISKWVTELFAEELSRDRGGTMIFKGVGEVILPDLDAAGEAAAKDAASGPGSGSGGASESGASQPSGADSSAGGAANEPEEPVDLGSSGGIPLERGRGGGSIGQPRPPIAAPSRSMPVTERSSEIDLGDMSRSELLKPNREISVSLPADMSGRANLIEEGVIDRRVDPREDSDRFSDDKTALADDDLERRNREKNAELESEDLDREETGEIDERELDEAGKIDEPEMSAPPKRNALYDDSKTEWGPDLSEDEAPDGSDDVSEEMRVAEEATWIPLPGESGPRASIADADTRASAGGHRGSSTAPTAESIEDVSMEAEPIGPEDDDLDPRSPDEDDSQDIWNEATVGYPGGQAPPALKLAGDDDDDDDNPSGSADLAPAADKSGDALAQAKTGEMHMLPSRPRAISVRDVAGGWEGLSRDSSFETDSTKRGDEDLWDDKTTTNDAYQADDSIPAPVVGTVERADSDAGIDLGDATISGAALSDDMLGEVSGLQDVHGSDGISGENTLSAISLAGRDDDDVPDASVSEVLADPTISASALGDEIPDFDRAMEEQTTGFDEEVGSVDATIAGAPALEERTGEMPDFGSGDFSTSPALDEESVLPVPKSNKNVDADSRTVAGVASDYLNAGINVPEGGAYDAHDDEGIELDLSGKNADEEAEKARPKLKRGGRGLGAIKLSKIPVDREKSDSGRFDPSEEMTEAGSALERPISTPKIDRSVSLSKNERASSPPKMARAPDFDDKLNNAFDEALSSVETTDEPTEGVSAIKVAKAKAQLAKSSSPKHESPKPIALKMDARPAPSPLPRLEPAKPALKMEARPAPSPLPKLELGKSSSSPKIDKKAVTQPPVPPPFDPFDEFPIDGDEKPPSVRAPIPISARIPPPLNPPAQAPSQPMGIGSTNVPPAHLSLSEILSVPVSGGGAGRGFQVLGRGNSVAGNSGGPASPSGGPVAPSVAKDAARARGASMPKREIRERVRPASPEGTPEPSRAGMLELPQPSALQSPSLGQPAPLADFGFGTPPMFAEEAAPRRSSQRTLLFIGIVLAFLALVGAGFLLVPQLFPRDPQLTIRTVPDGAEIYLNGQLQQAKTPATLGGLQPGVTYELRLVHEGFETVSKAVPIPKNTRNILVQIPMRAMPK